MLHVPGGDGAALARVDWVELFAEAGVLVDRLGVGIAEQQLRCSTVVTQGCLQRVVVGVGDRPIGGVFAVVLSAGSDERSSALPCARACDRVAG